MRLFLVPLALATPALAAEVQVPADFATIQEAVDAAAPGDTIVVADGRWTGTGNRDIEFSGKDVVVRSANGPRYCTIDCEGTPEEPYRAFLFLGGESSASVVEGFTITGGATLPGAINDLFNGGAIQIVDASPTIRNCRFVGNYAGCWGGAVYCASSGRATVENCHFEGNYSDDDGGGFFCWNGAQPTIRDSVFVRNEARVTGGAISSFGGGSLTIENTTVVGNHAPNGSGVFAFDTTTITSSLVWGNTGATLQIQGNPITVKFSDVMGGFAGVGNIDLDPKLAPDGYHLASGSPCIDAGDPSLTLHAHHVDIDGERRIRRTCVDIGADEFSLLRPRFDSPRPLH